MSVTTMALTGEDRPVLTAWRQSLLADFTSDAQETIFRASGLVDLPPIETLSERNVVLVVTGLVRVLYAEGSRQVTLRYAGAGDLAGVALALGTSVDLKLQALTPTRVLHINGDLFRELVVSHPRNAIRVAQATAEANALTQDVLVNHVFLPVRNRVIRHLLDRAERGPQPGLLSVSVSNQEIANAIGSVPTVIARVIADLQSARVLRKEPRRLLILDASRLHQLSQPTY